MAHTAHVVSVADIDHNLGALRDFYEDIADHTAYLLGYLAAYIPTDLWDDALQFTRDQAARDKAAS